MTILTDEIRQRPVILPKLEVFDSNGDDLGRASGVFTEDDDGGFGARARRFGVWDLRGKFAGFVDLQSSWMPLLGYSPCCLNGDKFRPCGKLAVNTGCDLGLTARRVKTLVALHITKQAGVVSTAAGTGDMQPAEPARLMPTGAVWHQMASTQYQHCL